MKLVTNEWVLLAEDDLRSAKRGFRARKLPSYASACYHAQQCAEKYLKALLQERGIAVPRSHDLPKLVSLIQPALPELILLRNDLKALTGMAVEVRYPGAAVEKEDARQAIKVAERVRAILRLHLKFSAD